MIVRPVIVLVGKSASGKSSVESNIVKKCGYEKIISYTTRKPRNNETNGVNYHFVNNLQFQKLAKQNFFAETSEYNGWYYGSAKKDYVGNKVVVLTPHGLRQIKNIKDIETIVFYINVPRRDRLIKILQRGDDIDEAYRRNISDVGQFDGIKDEVDYIIDNLGYKKSVDDVMSEIITGIDLKINEIIQKK